MYNHKVYDTSSFSECCLQIYTELLDLNNALKELLLVTIVASQTRGTMEQQCCGNSYSVQRDLFIYTSATVTIDHVRSQKRKLPTGGRY